MAEPPPHDTTPRWGEAGIHGVARPREWDAVVTAEADVAGDRADFVALADGTLVVEEGSEDGLDDLAAAVETELAPPYRAEAVRRGSRIWAVAGRRIRVVRLPGRSGDELELILRDGGRTLLVDGEPALGSVPALEELARGDAAVRARRIDGDDWEVRVDRL